MAIFYAWVIVWLSVLTLVTIIVMTNVERRVKHIESMLTNIKREHAHQGIDKETGEVK